MFRSTVFISLFFIPFLSFSQETSEKFAPEQTWHLLDLEDDSIYGVSVNKAYESLVHFDQSNSITVAVIDGDLDVNHEDLKNRLWTADPQRSSRYENLKHGWNFLGTSDGDMITKVGSEAFREYKRLRPKYEGKEKEDFKRKRDREEFEYFEKVKKDAKIQGYLNFFPIIELTFDAFRITDSLLREEGAHSDNLTLVEIKNFQVADSSSMEYVDAVKRSVMQYKEDVLWQDVFENQKKEYDMAVDRIKSLDNTSNPRDSIGDNADKLSDRYYGNAVLVDSTSSHGTLVAGLIAAERNNNIGIDGVAEKARIMGVRAVPDGDEFDKDVALAIRFAVDQGAKIINMSFGKPYSPNHKWVDKAIKYAVKKNVLLVQAAGNDNHNIDSIALYPQPYIKKKKNAHLIIGASTKEGEKAKFSNYGEEQVDFFAPGSEILSTKLGDEYMKASGTSFSAPIVSGVAAMVWSQYPQLKAYQVADILKESARKNEVEDLKGKAAIPGIVNAYDALEIAKEYVEKN